jgi:periplasmic protein TonB
MDYKFLKSFFFSFVLHILLIFLLFLFNFTETTKEEDVYREVSFVVERDFPEKKQNESISSLAQKKQVVATPKKENPKPIKEQIPKPDSKKEEQKEVTSKKVEINLPEIDTQKINTDLVEQKDPEEEDVSSKVVIPEQDTKVEEKDDNISDKDLPGSDFGDDIVDLRPSKNLELFGPIVNRRIVYSEVPEYPDWAKSQGVESEVRMKFWVEPDGKVVNAEVVQKSGYLRLDLLAINSLLKWKFTPLDEKDPQIKQWGEIVVRFILY